MSFVINDYTHTLNIGMLSPSLIARCLAGWRLNLQDGSRKLGFIVELISGRYAYVTGGCGKTGWGEDDEAEYQFLEDCLLERLNKPESAVWIENPQELNEWIARGSCEPYPWG